MCVQAVCVDCNRIIFNWLCEYGAPSFLKIRCKECSPNKMFKVLVCPGIDPFIAQKASFCNLDGYIYNPYVIYNPELQDKLRSSFNAKQSVVLQHDVRVHFQTYSTPAIISIDEIEEFVNNCD